VLGVVGKGSPSSPGKKIGALHSKQFETLLDPDASPNAIELAINN